MIERYDFLIVGGGIAGASIGYYLAEHGSVLMLEMEAQAGYHTTGRSAAFFAETYGGPAIRPLTTASKSFFYTPPEGFAEVPLINQRGALHIFDEARAVKAVTVLKDMQRDIPAASALTADDVMSRAPHIAGEILAGGLFDPDCGDLDVAAIHQGFLKGYKKHGGKIALKSQLKSATRTNNIWRVETLKGTVEASTVINTGGAWADEIAEKVGAEPLGLTPLRRTLVTIASDDADGSGPLVLDLDENYYIKPENGIFLVSPCDETLSPPCDAQPDEIDVAVAVEMFSKATGKTVRSIVNSWAGLRTFAPDNAPIIGFDPKVEGFFWSVGQGGYGIQTSPAWGRTAAQLLITGDIPSDVKAAGASKEVFAPGRFDRD